MLEEAAKRKIAVVVLDRPNPIGGWQIEGPVLDAEPLSFVAYTDAAAARHDGRRAGELFNAERKIGADLTVVTLEGWRRDQWFDQTGLPWVNPSPNMRNLTRRRSTRASACSRRRTSPSAAAPTAVRVDRRAVDRRPRAWPRR